MYKKLTRKKIKIFLKVQQKNLSVWYIFPTFLNHSLNGSTAVHIFIAHFSFIYLHSFIIITIFTFAPHICYICIFTIAYENGNRAKNQKNQGYYIFTLFTFTTYFCPFVYFVHLLFYYYLYCLQYASFIGIYLCI